MAAIDDARQRAHALQGEAVAALKGLDDGFEPLRRLTAFVTGRS